MKDSAKTYTYTNLFKVAERLRSDILDLDSVILFAYNGTGKTRLSMAFKDKGKKKNHGKPDTLYFNAFTEDLFYWDNDLDNDTRRILRINEKSSFFKGLKELSIEEKVFNHLERYADFNFRINYEDWSIIFRKTVPNPKYNPRNPDNTEPETIELENIKISRGEENIFVFCIFLAICELVIEGNEAYNWVKYIYIDDPISSLDENNAITVSTDLSNLIKSGLDKPENEKVKFIVSTHHGLFFNVMYHELTKNRKSYFLHKNNDGKYRLQSTEDTPFFHHVASLCELQKAHSPGKASTYHFNMLRSVLEKTSAFFGYDNFSHCIKGVEDEVLFDRALNIMSHGRYSIFNPVKMEDDTQDLFDRILDSFLEKYDFALPALFKETK